MSRTRTLPAAQGDPAPVTCASRRIEDYALVGSTHSAALIHRDGNIEWLCLPRFDSGAMFASLLGDKQNGSWSLYGTHAQVRTTRRYLPGTMVLETTIRAPDGEATVTDFMPCPVRDGTHEIVRIVRGVRGTVKLRTEIRIRFNYGQWVPWVERRSGAIYAVAGPDAVRLTSTVAMVNEDFASCADFSVTADKAISFCLEWFPSHLRPPVTRDAFSLLECTTREWQVWSGRCCFEGKYHDEVVRSLLTLKALTYEPTGGIVAAPTTSLPEHLGGDRNWDYRYCWLRDAALTLYALIASGYVDEASEWRWWLMRAVGGAPEDLQVMYGLHGERALTEGELDWLPGYEASRPVRIGNGAHRQRQLDVYGSVIAAFYAARKAGLADMDTVWPLERAIARQLTKLWREPDCSLWEVRGELRHFVHSKIMCWLAFDRMIASATEFQLEGPIAQWRAVRDEIHADVCANGFHAQSNAFVQSYGADAVDAALLLMPLIGFLPIHDTRVRGTIARIERELVYKGLVFRYRAEDGVDGLAGGEGAFLACSFWLSDVYVAMGRPDKARALFRRLLALGNDLGLFAEEYDPVAQRQLGNFPQAFSHLGLINSARALATATGGIWALADRDGYRHALQRPIVVVFGVSTSGKSTLGRVLAQQFQCAFKDGDELHPATNVNKMRVGIALGDDDRGPWLTKVSDWMQKRVKSGRGGVIACSALKQADRDRLREAVPNAAFVLLAPSEATLRRRSKARKRHFMSPSLLASQLRTLEVPVRSEHALVIEGKVEIAEACLQVLAWLLARPRRGVRKAQLLP